MRRSDNMGKRESVRALTIFVAGIVLTSLLHTWHVKRMTRWDNNFVTPDEVVEEQKWGSA